MALVASNALVVPLQTEFFALEGLTQLMKTIEKIKSNLNPSLEIESFLQCLIKINFQVRLKLKQKLFQRKSVFNCCPKMLDYPKLLHTVYRCFYMTRYVWKQAYFKFTDEFLEQDKQVVSAA